MKRECDIILLSYENPDLLKRCAQSVLDKTTVNSRLIVVDNASRNPEVKKYLNVLEGNERVSVEKIFSDENSGFAGGINKGMKISEAPYVCLLNNDCEVTEGWIREMIFVAESSSQIGIVNPQSNTFGSVPRDGMSIDDHSAIIKKNAEKYLEVGHAIGFACLIKREVIDKIGYLDEIFAGVCYEDTDFSLRAKAAGYIAVIAEGAYVFHQEQASRKNLLNKKEIYEANRKIFEKRWGKILRILFIDPETQRQSDVYNYYEALKKLARQRTFLTVWTVSGRPGSRADDGIKEGLLVRHLDVSLKVFRRAIKPLDVIIRVLTKKKKYDAVVVHDRTLVWVLRLLKPFHKSEVMFLENEFDLITGTGKKLSFFGEAEGIAAYLRDKRG